MALPILAGLATAVIGASASKKASRAQSEAADAQTQLGYDQLSEGQRQFDLTMDRNREVYSDQINRLAPFANTTSQQALMSEYGLADAPSGYAGFQATPFQREAVTRQPDYQREQFTASPGYQFMLDESNRAIEGSAASRGQLFSGRTLEALQQNSQNLANQEFGNFQARQDALQLQQKSRADSQYNLDRSRQDSLQLQNQGRNDALRQNYLAQLAGLAGAAQSAATGQAQAGGQFGTASANASNALMANNANATNFMGNALANYGDAQAAGAIGVNNALANGLNTGVGLWQYQNAQQANPTSGQIATNLLP